jgi:hypothetical protein
MRHHCKHCSIKLAAYHSEVLFIATFYDEIVTHIRLISSCSYIVLLAVCTVTASAQHCWRTAGTTTTAIAAGTTLRYAHSTAITATALTTSITQDKDWKVRAGKDMQALGRRLGHKNRRTHTRGEWGTGLNDPWKSYGKSTAFLVLLGLVHGGSAFAVDLAIVDMQKLRQTFSDGRYIALLYYTIILQCA